MAMARPPRLIRFADSEGLHQKEGGECGGGQDQGHHQGSAQVAQENDQEDDHEHNRDQQRLGDGAHGFLDQVGAVVEDFDLYAVRQAGLEFLELVLDTMDDGTCVGASQGNDDTLNGFVLAVAHDRAVAREAADADIGDVADAQNLAIRFAHDEGANVPFVLGGADGADDEGLLAFGNAAGAIVAVIILKRHADVVEADTCRRHRGLIGDDLEGPYTAA